MMMEQFFTAIDLNNIAVMTKEFMDHILSPCLALFGILGNGHSSAVLFYEDLNIFQ